MTKEAIFFTSSDGYSVLDLGYSAFLAVLVFAKGRHEIKDQEYARGSTRAGV